MHEKSESKQILNGRHNFQTFEVEKSVTFVTGCALVRVGDFSRVARDTFPYITTEPVRSHGKHRSKNA